MTSAKNHHLSASAGPNRPAIPYLFKRGTSYYFKRRIPKDVIAAFPGSTGQIWKSLDTAVISQARVRLAVEIAEFELVVATFRQNAQYCESATPAALQGSELRLSVKNVAEQPSRMASSRMSGGQASVMYVPVCATGTASAYSPVGGQGASLTMSHLFEDWKRKQSRARTINAVGATVSEFRDLHGPIPVRGILRGHGRAFRNELVERGLSKGTILNKIGFLATLVRHGMGELVEDLVLNPFERIEVVGDQRKRAAKDRRAYEVREMNTIFGSKLYTGGYRPKGQAVDAAYWLPVLGPFIGARIEELCQARVEDVQRVNGVWCLRICDLGEDQKVKTDSSFRRVPLHEAVVNSGFLRYVAHVAAAGHDRLFPSLSNKNANRVFSNAPGKWFGRYLEAIGLDDPRLDYHSYRYTFRQQCSLCGVDNETRDALTGHWLNSSDAGRTYMRAEQRQYPFPKLVAAMRQLQYAELDISHLFVANPLYGLEELMS